MNRNDSVSSLSFNQDIFVSPVELKKKNYSKVTKFELLNTGWCVYSSKHGWRLLKNCHIKRQHGLETDKVSPLKLALYLKNNFPYVVKCVNNLGTQTLSRNDFYRVRFLKKNYAYTKYGIKYYTYLLCKCLKDADLVVAYIPEWKNSYTYTANRFKDIE